LKKRKDQAQRREWFKTSCKLKETLNGDPEGKKGKKKTAKQRTVLAAIRGVEEFLSDRTTKKRGGDGSTGPKRKTGKGRGGSVGRIVFCSLN